jgi:hypothetical protein
VRGHSQGERLAKFCEARRDARVGRDEWRLAAIGAPRSAGGDGARPVETDPAAGHEYAAAGPVADTDDPSVEHLRERLAEAAIEQRGKVRAASRRQACEQSGPRAVDREHLSVRRRGDEAGRQCVEKLAPRMKGEDETLAPVLKNETVLDLDGGHAHQSVRVLLTRFVGARGVKQADQRAARIGDRRRHAAQAPVRGEEMLAAIDRGRSLCGESKPQRVGAPRAFEPHAAGDDVAPRVAVDKDLVAQRVEHDTLRVGEGDHEIRSGNLRMQRLHLGERTAAQGATRIAPARDIREWRDDRGWRARGVEAEVQAASPALDDRPRERGFRNPLTALERDARAIDRAQRLLHGQAPSMRMRGAARRLRMMSRF